MLTEPEKLQPRRWSKRILLIGLLVLLVLGGLYWQQRIEVPAKPLVINEVAPVIEQPVSSPSEVVVAAPKADSAQSLPVDVPVSKPTLIKRPTKLAKERDEVYVVAAAEPVVSKTPPTAAKALPPVERPAVVPAVQVEAAPLTADTRSKAPDIAPAMVQTELKPVVQPIPVPVAAVSTPVSTSVPIPLTASAAPVPKRKAKNDEDVEIDP
ncbi:hypothetical protein [Fibrella aquatilis]|uniref:Uncharacterized protein n=1 Tax=Fibrella aquatilis TaxID=2817059 RepID=A0A939JYW1_9BACT|nr:hypothetical protein [Fibrella aquatilis]MBO0930788.1 hypothetical protein [Fibrella aquatilis]